jgi:hypothetical protein
MLNAPPAIIPDAINYGLLFVLPPLVLVVLVLAGLLALVLPPVMLPLFALPGLLALALPPVMLALLPVMLALLMVVPVVLVPVVPVVVVVVVVLFVVVLFMLPVPVFVLSVVVHPAQKTATASRAKRAKVLRIEFSPVTQWVNVLGAVRAFSLPLIKGFRINSVKVRATRVNALRLPRTWLPKSERGHVECSQSMMLGV